MSNYSDDMRSRKQLVTVEFPGEEKLFVFALVKVLDAHIQVRVTDMREDDIPLVQMSRLVYIPFTSVTTFAVHEEQPVMLTWANDA